MRISDWSSDVCSSDLYSLDPAELLGDEAKDYDRITDILDVWFDSGVTHETVLLERGLGKPADLYLEGSDQHRGWFQSSLLTGIAIDRAAPYRQCLTHGFTVRSEEHTSELQSLMRSSYAGFCLKKNTAN